MHSGHATQLTSLLRLPVPFTPLQSPQRRFPQHRHYRQRCEADAEPRQEGQTQRKRPDEHIKRIKEFGCDARHTLASQLVALSVSQRVELQAVLRPSSCLRT